MKIFLCNFDDATGPSRFTSLQVANETSSANLEIFGGTDDLSASWTRVHTDAAQEDVLALVHVSKLSLAEIVKISNGSPLPEKLMIILFSGGGVAEAMVSESAPGGLQFQGDSSHDHVFLYRSSFSTGFPQDILDAVKAFRAGRFTEFVRGFSLALHEWHLAYRLLHEARSLCGNDASRSVPGSELTIHAPKSLEDWWMPFDSEDCRDEAKAIRVLARCIVDKGDPGGESGWSKVKTNATSGDDKALKSAVAAFLNVTDTDITKH